jgi:hypothetical protein
MTTKAAAGKESRAMWRRLIPILVLAVLAASACGDDESVFDQGTPTTAGPAGTTGTTGSGGQTTATLSTTTTQAAETTLGGGEQAMAGQIAAELLAGGGGELGLSIDEEAAQCLGNQMVAAFGLERLEQLAAGFGSESGLGSAVEQMTPEELSTLTGVLLNGVGGQSACIDVRSLLTEAFVQSGLSAGSAECVANALTQGTVLQDMLGSALGAAEAGGEMDPEVMTQLMTVMMGCLTPEELTNLGGIDLGS